MSTEASVTSTCPFSPKTLFKTRFSVFINEKLRETTCHLLLLQRKETKLTDNLTTVTMKNKYFIFLCFSAAIVISTVYAQETPDEFEEDALEADDMPLTRRERDLAVAETAGGGGKGGGAAGGKVG